MPNPENLKEPWKEGDPSPNPSGRPKGSRNLSTILREMLEEEIEVIIDGVKSKKQFQEVIIRKLVKKANDGDLRAIQEIFDRTEGKAKQEVKSETKTELSVKFDDAIRSLVSPAPSESAKDSKE
jgi:hypothetical protein